MAEKTYNPGFAFYKDYYDSIQHLTLEQQKEACYAIVKYGITNEMVDSKEMPIGLAMAQGFKRSIDNSVERWLDNQNKATQKMDNTLSRDHAIAKLISQGYKSKDIAEIISEQYEKMSDSGVRKTRPWKERNDKDFASKWLTEKCDNFHEMGQNLQENSCENLRDKCENSREIHGTDSQNSQNGTKEYYFSGF